MLHVPIPRLQLLALGILCAVASGVGGDAWAAPASPGAQDPPEERSESPSLDELLNRFPIGSEPVLARPGPAPPPAAVSPPRAASGSESTWIAVLAAAGAIVLLAAVGAGAVALRRGRGRPAIPETSTPGVSLLHETLALALHETLALANQERDKLHPATPLTRRSPPVSEVSQDRNPPQPELQPAEAEQARPAEPQIDDSEPVREQEYTRVGDRVAALSRLPFSPFGGPGLPSQELPRLRVDHVLNKKAIEPAANGGVAEGADEPEALVPANEADYIQRNRAAWERWAPEYAATGRKAWQEKDVRWGIWGVPESALRIFEGLEPGDDVIELGCGTAVVSAWLARRGAKPVAIDIAPAQLRTADSLQREFRLSFPLVCANAEQVPLDDAGFDLAISEYGPSLWCDPRRWLPEAHRLLRPDGRLVFFTNGALLMACTPPDGGPAGDRLVRDYFSRDRVEFPEDGAVEFHATHGRWVRLLRASGFALENLLEVRPPPETKAARFEFASVEWARRWPSEEIWVARKAAANI